MDYDIWAVIKESEAKYATFVYYYNVTVGGERLAWAIVGSYSAASGTIQWFLKPTLASSSAGGYHLVVYDASYKLY